MNLIVRLAWRNLWRNKRRTWLTVGAMVFSNVLLVFMISLQLGSYQVMIDNALEAFSGHLQVQSAGYNDDPKLRNTVPAVRELAAELRAELGSDGAVAARAVGFALASSERRSYGIQVIGVEPAHEVEVSNLPGLVKQGRYLADPFAAEIVVGSVLARNLRVGVGEEITLLGSGRDGSLAAGVVTVVGILDSGVTDLDRSIAEMPIGAFQETFAMGDTGHMVVVRAPDLTSVDAWVERTAAHVGAASGLVVLDWDALQPGLRQAIQADFGSAMFMYAVLIVLVAFSVLNTQLMSVLERTREFGIVLALGLRTGKIGRLVLLEAAMMASVGLLAGAALGYLLALWIGHTGFYYPGMEESAAKFNLPSRIYPQVSLLSILLGPSFVFVGSVLAGLYPALRVRTLRPVEAMRAV